MFQPDMLVCVREAAHVTRETSLVVATPVQLLMLEYFARKVSPQAVYAVALLLL